MRSIGVGLAVVLLVACRDEPKPQPMFNTSTTSTPSMTAPAVMASTPTAAKKPYPLPAFAGFSRDGKTFAWVEESATGSGAKWTKKVSAGDKAPKQEILDGELDAGAGALVKAGFTAERKAPPSDLTLESELTAKPPRLTLKRGGKTVEIPQNNYPYPPTDVAEIWGVSADGKYVAVHVSGMSVDGLLTKAGTGVFHFVFVAPMP